MSLLTILVILIIVGVVLYLINTFIPMDGNVKKVMNIFVIIVLIVWLLRAVGAFVYLSAVRF